MAQNDFLICKVKGGGVVVATATANNTTYRKSDKSIWWLLNIHYTSTSLQSNLYVLVILLVRFPLQLKVTVINHNTPNIGLQTQFGMLKISPSLLSLFNSDEKAPLL